MAKAEFMSPKAIGNRMKVIFSISLIDKCCSLTFIFSSLVERSSETTILLSGMRKAMP